MNDQFIENTPGTPAHSPTLRDVLAPLFRHRQLVVLSFLGIFLGAVLGVFLLPKQYEARLKILVNRERVDPVVTSDRSALPSFSANVSEEELNSEVELLKSRDLLEKVVLACDLQRLNSTSFWTWLFPGATGTAREPRKDSNLSEAVRVLEKKLQVEPIKKTSVISVKYGSADPVLAAQVLSALANMYLEKHVAVHRPPGAFDFFQRETERYHSELRTAEARLANFNRDEGVVAPQLEKEITLQKLTEFDAKLRSTQAEVAETEKRISEMERQLRNSPLRQTTQIREWKNPGLLQQLRSTLLNLELKHTELLEKYAPDYRPVREVEKQIAQARAAIVEAESEPVREQTTDRDPTHEWLRAELVKSKAELAGLQARAMATARVVQAYLEKARDIDQKGTVHQSLLRSAKAAEENYLLYLHKEEEARISDALDRQRIVNVAIAEAPTVPSLPSSPGWRLTLLVAGLLASLVSVGLAFIVDYLDPSFRTPYELQEFLHLPVLAATPKDAS